MRAREPDLDGYVETGGVKVHYEVHGPDEGDGVPTLLLLPAWLVVHSRFWKAQVPYLARHFRVVTYDGPGNGRSDRPLDPRAYDHDAEVAHAVAVLDATGTDRAVVVGLSLGGCRALQLAAEHADRVLGTVLIGPTAPLVDRGARDAPPRTDRDPSRRPGSPSSGATRSSTGRSTTRPTGPRATRTSSGSSSASASRSPTPAGRSSRRSSGGWRPRPTSSSPSTGRPRPRVRPSSAGARR